MSREEKLVLVEPRSSKGEDQRTHYVDSTWQQHLVDCTCVHISAGIQPSSPMSHTDIKNPQFIAIYRFCSITAVYTWTYGSEWALSLRRTIGSSHCTLHTKRDASHFISFTRREVNEFLKQSQMLFRFVLEICKWLLEDHEDQFTSEQCVVDNPKRDYLDSTETFSNRSKTNYLRCAQLQPYEAPNQCTFRYWWRKGNLCFFGGVIDFVYPG